MSSTASNQKLVDEQLKEIQWRLFRLQIDAPKDFRLASINAKCKELEKRISSERQENEKFIANERRLQRIRA